MQAAVFVVALIATLGCRLFDRTGTTPGTHTTDEESFWAPPYPFHSTEPERPPELLDQVLSARAFRVTRACTQGPLEFDMPAASASYTRRFSFWLCSPRPVAGRYRFEQDGQLVEERNFGPDRMRPSERCQASAAEARESSGGGPRSGLPPSSAAGSGGGSREISPPGGSPGVPAPVLLEETPWDATQAQCSSQYQIHLGGITGFSSVELPSRSFRVRVWFDAPAHLEGAVFVAWQAGLTASVDAAAWARHYAWLQTAWENARRSGRVVEAADATRVGALRAGDHGIPPAARVEVQTPRPSANAFWIDGYWRWGHTDWVWFDGFWRVPPADIEAELTVQTEQAPPPAPARVEVVPEKPLPEAVWAAGHWEWNGAAYVWVVGTWRLPPAGGNVWVQPAWRRVGARFVFDPGRWTIRVGN